MDSIFGLQLENTVLHNRAGILEHLNIDPNDVIYDNPYFQRPTQRQKGCQIDYLIQTRDRTLYVCEIKSSRNPIPAGVTQEVAEKIKRLQLPRGMSYRPVLIYSGTLTDTLHDDEYFSSKLDLASLFSLR